MSQAGRSRREQRQPENVERAPADPPATGMDDAEPAAPGQQAAEVRREINTWGGASIGGSVDTASGDFVGRDKIVVLLQTPAAAPGPTAASSGARRSLPVWGRAGGLVLALVALFAAWWLNGAHLPVVSLPVASPATPVVLPTTAAPAVGLPRSPSSGGSTAEGAPPAPGAQALAAGPGTPATEAPLEARPAAATAPLALASPTAPGPTAGPGAPDPALAAVADRMAQRNVKLQVYPQQAAWSPSGDLLAVAATGVTLYDAQTMEPVRSIRIEGWAGGVAFSHDGRLLAVSTDQGLSLRDPATGGEIRNFAEIPHAGRSAFSPDDTMLAVVIDRVAELVAVADGHVLNTFTGDVGAPPRAVSFSPDGSVLAVAGQTVKLWDPATGRELRTLNGHGNSVTDVAFSPDGTRIATSSIDQTARLWDAATGRELATLTGHTAEVDAVTFSPDGQLLATAAWDMTVRLWEVATGRALRTLRGHTNELRTAAFAPKGLVLASGDFNDLRIWAPR